MADAGFLRAPVDAGRGGSGPGLPALSPDATDDLRLPLGLPGSGRARYAAAMARYAEGRMSARELEVYRIAAARDGEDAAALLARGVAGRVPG